MKSFFLGIIVSIISSGIVYLLRFNIGFIISTIFYKFYPNVSGQYDVYNFRINKGKKLSEGANHEEKTKRLNIRATDRQLLAFLKQEKREYFVKLELKQFANRLSGVLYKVEDGIRTDIEKVKGYITSSRVVILNSETVIEDHHNFGTYLLTLKNDSHILKGVRNYLCISCGEANPGHIILNRNN